MLVGDGGADGIDIGVTLDGRGFVHVAHVHHGLVRQEVQVARHLLFFGVLGNDRAA